MNGVTGGGAVTAGFTGAMIASTVMWGFACMNAHAMVVPEMSLVLQWAGLMVPIANALYGKVLNKVEVEDHPTK